MNIIQLKSIPANVDRLVKVSEMEGYIFVRRFIEEWANGSNQFNKAGEILFGAEDGKSLVGICGINIDPYIEKDGVGRLRHLYVDPVTRGNSVGRMLVSRCIDFASESYHTLRLRTPDTKSHTFYGHMGFQKIVDPTATHELVFVDRYA